MKKYFLAIAASFLFHFANANDNDSTVYYNLHDSVKAVQFLAEVNIPNVNINKSISWGIKTDAVNLYYSNKKGKESITFWVSDIASSSVAARGLNVTGNPKGWFEFKEKAELSNSYKLMIAVANDSAGNFSLYTGYAWLPEKNKWKLIASCKINGRRNTIQRPAVFYSLSKREQAQIKIGSVWCQRQNGSWMNLKNDSLPNPTINLFGHIDSVQQRKLDIKIIDESIVSGKTDVKENAGGIYYKILKEGTGKQVSADDMVTIFYKGYLFENNSVFDQTKEKPATFPLKRLIKGWQIGVPLCKVGGKIKIVIPSDMAYSIRTRSAKIPPNSILVFEIEVVEAKLP